MDDVVLITPPVHEPVTVEEVKSQARIYTDADDVFIENIVIPGARDAVETELRRVLITQTWKLTCDGFPGSDRRYESHGPAILLPKPPCQSITSFTYVDTAGVTQNLPACNADGSTPNGEMYGYQLDPVSETQPGRISPAWARTWPTERRVPSCVQITFVCGYGGFATDATKSPAETVWRGQRIPPMIKAAILVQSAFMYENREASDLAPGVANMLSPYVNRIA